jgi:O-antigen ligase
MVGLALFLREPRVRLRRPSVRAASTAVAILALTTAGLVVSGTGARFTKRDAPHVGLNFRTDEVRSFFRLPTNDLLFGQGFGGRFESKDVNGLPVITGWSHVLPVWIWLKVGLIGSVAVLTATILALRKAFHALRPKPRLHDPDAALALVMMAGLLLMSLTINRVALPEGAVLFGCALGLLDRKEKDLPS